jgi:hypothetical protein
VVDVRVYRYPWRFADEAARHQAARWPDGRKRFLRLPTTTVAETTIAMITMMMTPIRATIMIVDSR